MLTSMTGFGSATTRDQGFLFSSEIKAVNNRFLKATIRLPDGFASLETKIEELIRSRIARGSVYYTLTITRDAPGAAYKIDQSALRFHLESLRGFQRDNPELTANVPFGSLVEFARLPGVMQQSEGALATADALWSSISANATLALDALQKMRETEGATTQNYLADIIAKLRVCNDQVKAFAPTVVENYRARLTERVAKVLAENNAPFDSVDLIREIAIYTDRVDISEEIARFYSHLDQFVATMDSEAACGKKLDFLTQEMFRETNTIGSKANSPELLKLVVEMKSEIERAREMVQNVE
ncbi:MAG: YicC family protein [Thermoguttaceae bacterium]|nr:YicC family protein [Thermoguttaceae bacterium]